MYIFYCQKCNEIDALKSKTGIYKCPDCGSNYLPLGVTVDEWNEFSDDEIRNTILKAKNSAVKTPNLNKPIVGVHTHNKEDEAT